MLEELRGFRRFVLPRHNARDLGFTGKLIASSHEETQLGNLARLEPTDPDDQIPIAAVFQLTTGKYVCFVRSVQNGQFDFQTKVFLPDQIWQVQEFFIERGAAGKQLLRNWGVNIIEEIE